MAAQYHNDPNGTRNVILVGMDIPFGDLVVFLVKVSVAAIPAALILGFFGLVAFFFITAIGAGL